MSRKKLLILTPGFAESESDTTCISALQLYIKELLRRDLFEIFIITFHYPFTTKEYDWYNVKVIPLGGSNKKGIHRLINLRKAFTIANKLQRTNHIDYIQSFWLGECAWLGQRISKRHSIPHFCTLMGQDAIEVNWRMKKKKNIPRLVTLSKFHAQKLVENIGITTDYVIPWGVEKEVIKSNSSRNIDILGVGNLISLKDFERFIVILSQLKIKFPKIRAEIIGVGLNKNSLARSIEKNKLEDNVFLIGRLDRKQVLAKMGQSKCLLHCSIYESFGMVIPESLSQGAYVFSTAVGIAPEVSSISLFNTNEEAIQQLSQFFQQNPGPNFQTPFLISNTVDSYLNKLFLLNS